MNMKKVLPVIMLVVLAIITLAIKRCNSTSGTLRNGTSVKKERTIPIRNNSVKRQSDGLDRNTDNLYFTKHAKCRMKCRGITQQEVKDILANGSINYNKSDLNDPKGPTYALEGMTKDDQHVRIIFSPKQSHLTVVTVIDLDIEHECNCA